MEKMTKPANMLVKELMQQTMTESLYGRDKAQGSHCHAYITSLSTRHTLSRGVLGGGRGRGGPLDIHFASGGTAEYISINPPLLKWQRAAAASRRLEDISSHFPGWHHGRARLRGLYAAITPWKSLRTAVHTVSPLVRGIQCVPRLQEVASSASLGDKHE